ncbi:hypothetical protein PINS_up002105 [Pythium insidiosum]|nr:hypothetical protein PINS_up002105 [Pythium insidiosum]
MPPRRSTVAAMSRALCVFLALWLASTDALVVSRPCCHLMTHVSGEFTDREALRQGAMVNKELVAATPFDGCAPMENGAALLGRVALVRRGECNFVRKVWHAQLAGAVGVVVMDDAARSEYVDR